MLNKIYYLLTSVIFGHHRGNFLSRVKVLFNLD